MTNHRACVRDDLFNTNASIVKGIAEQCAKRCPKACFLIISNPVNSTVPIFADVLKVPCPLRFPGDSVP